MRSIEVPRDRLRGPLSSLRRMNKRCVAMPFPSVTALNTIRLGLDIGGTFTDVALEAGGRRVTAKTLTTSGAPDAKSTESMRVRRATPNWLSAVGHQRRLRRLTGISAQPPESRHPDDRRSSSVWAIRYRVEPP
jgi:hypothetical protein